MTRRLALAAGAAVSAAAVVVAFAGGVLVGDHLDRTPASAAPGVRASEVADVLAETFYRPVDALALRRMGETGSIDAMVASLGDPYTTYLSGDELAALDATTSGRYAGVGVVLRAAGDRVLIGTVAPRSPAAAAGLRRGDQVVAVDGARLTRIDAPAVVDRLRGPVGSRVSLAVRRGGRVMTRALVRRDLAVGGVTTRVLGRGTTRTAVVRLDAFSRGTTRAVAAAIHREVDRGARAVVLDLRGNPGGLLDEGVGVASLFVAGGPVVRTSGVHAGTVVRLAGHHPPFPRLPLAVTVDGRSASAAEIVAGALRDRGRAAIVGRRTFGKGVVQGVRRFGPDEALKVTVATYTTPSGARIDGRGVAPTIPAAPARAVARAVAALCGGAGPCRSAAA